MPQLNLACPNGCTDGRFEALNAPLIVDSSGHYVEHRAGTATYVCERCQSIAVDIAAAARELEQGEHVPQEVLVCPGCGLEMLPPIDDPFASIVECPVCETRFGVEEGIERLHGGSSSQADGGSATSDHSQPPRI